MAYNILIVDDSLPMRSVVKKTIKASGFSSSNFYEAENGKQALDIIKQEWMDIIITDYNMPDMNGIELIKELKKDDFLTSIPILVVTTEGSQKKILEFMTHGASGYIKKPFTPELIREKLVEILGEAQNGFEESDEGLDF
ncbi:MAG: response regulator [Desulfobacterales bacterium]|nr:response regulator [Desulfobacterales bacterium]